MFCLSIRRWVSPGKAASGDSRLKYEADSEFDPTNFGITLIQQNLNS